jgi:hypothetical protein
MHVSHIALDGHYRLRVVRGCSFFFKLLISTFGRSVKLKLVPPPSLHPMPLVPAAAQLPNDERPALIRRSPQTLWLHCSSSVDTYLQLSPLLIIRSTGVIGRLGPRMLDVVTSGTVVSGSG